METPRQKRVCIVANSKKTVLEYYLEYLENHPRESLGGANEEPPKDTVQPSTSIPHGHVGHLDSSGVIWLDNYRQKRVR